MANAGPKLSSSLSEQSSRLEVIGPWVTQFNKEAHCLGTPRPDFVSKFQNYSSPYRLVSVSARPSSVSDNFVSSVPATPDLSNRFIADTFPVNTPTLLSTLDKLQEEAAVFCSGDTSIYPDLLSLIDEDSYCASKMSLEAERMYPVDEKGTFGQRDRQHVETFPETNLHLTNDSIHTKPTVEPQPRVRRKGRCTKLITSLEKESLNRIKMEKQRQKRKNSLNQRAVGKRKSERVRKPVQRFQYTCF